MKKPIILILMVALVIGIPTVLGLYLSLSLPPPPGGKQSGIILIPNGATMKDVASILHSRNLIRHKTLFVLYARMFGLDTQIKSGEYQFARKMIPYDILKKLIRGEQVKYSITVPEGYTVEQIADLYASVGLADRDQLIALSTDSEFITSLGIEAGALEGRLYPDTYKFVRYVKEEEIIRRMVKRFNSIFTDEMKHRTAELGFSEQEILTLASMIEKETGYAHEKPLVSAVFHNRLRRNMRFQCDPTVIYGLDNFSGSLTKEDLQTFTPYNTYVIDGLPPTPIANPGVDSINAALYPARVNYLYFVSKNDGTHYFSHSLAEHNRAVTLYQRAITNTDDSESEESP